MGNGKLLELIWQGAIRPAEGSDAARMARLLGALLPLKTICLTSSVGFDQSRVLTDEVELEPALPLGDVLSEELGLDVPYGTLVVVCAKTPQGTPRSEEELSHQLGSVVGEVLLDAVRRGAFSFEREASALYVMACSYHRIASCMGLQHHGLKPQMFRAGLAAKMAAYWLGERTGHKDDRSLFSTPDFLVSPTLRGYLKGFDTGFSAPEVDDIKADVMQFSGASHSYEEWLELAKGSVLGTLAVMENRQHENRILR